MEPTDRELERGIERVDPEPDELDSVEVWEAFITGKHPTEMDSERGANAVRGWWLVRFGEGDLDGVAPKDMSDEKIDDLDQRIREFDGYDGDGQPY